MTLNEREISTALNSYFTNQGLTPIGKLNVFNHIDDTQERTFIVDFAVAPESTKGERTTAIRERDQEVFRQMAPQIDEVINRLVASCEFPLPNDQVQGWQMQHNPNPVVGISVEIENAKSKYFLGSLLAASCTGRWGLLIVPDSPETNKWIQTVRRLIYKGNVSPIPANIIIFK